LERNFKGIWIPKEIWLSEELTLQEKVFLVEIDSLDNEQGCFAGNQYFSDFFGVSKVRVSEVINSLVKKGYITSEIIYKEGSKQILKRVLKISLIGYKRKVEEGIKEKFKDSNTVNNTVNKELYVDVFNHYISKDNLIKHKKLVIDMNKAIDKAIKNLSLDLDYIKRIIDRHSKKVEDTKNSNYPIKARTLSELFGQKKFESTSLICSDYLDELYTNEFKQEKPQQIFEIKRGAV
jgi:hypothetical protein